MIIYSQYDGKVINKKNHASSQHQADLSRFYQKPSRIESDFQQFHIPFLSIFGIHGTPWDNGRIMETICVKSVLNCRSPLKENTSGTLGPQILRAVPGMTPCDISKAETDLPNNSPFHI